MSVTIVHRSARLIVSPGITARPEGRALRLPRSDRRGRPSGRPDFVLPPNDWNDPISSYLLTTGTIRFRPTSDDWNDPIVGDDLQVVPISSYFCLSVGFACFSWYRAPCRTPVS